MSYELIISEKPSAAQKIAESLADGKAVKESVLGVPVYSLTHKKKDIKVVCAVGHLFSVAEKKKSFVYPSYDIHWVPVSSIDKSASFSKKYVDVIKKVSAGADSFTVACDYDVEGEVIGYNIITKICKQKDASRMKFSTLTKDELRSSYEHKLSHIDWGQARAGETRHFLDWLYGINLSRALMSAVKKAGSFKVLSSGRVQGPALKILVDKEREIQAFTPTPFWQLELVCLKDDDVLVALHSQDKFWEQKKAQAVFELCSGKDSCVESLTSKEFLQSPPTPFDLGSLQTECHKLFGISPKQTLAIAQSLYLEGATSYPRTSSQKLPKEIDYKKILRALSKKYPVQCQQLLGFKELKAHEGKKSDPAHPAIYPTGQGTKSSDEREKKVYDLIVKRFFAVFGSSARRETVTAQLGIEGEVFVAKGTRTLDAGWHTLYEPYVRLKEETLPALKQGEFLSTQDLRFLSKETSPAKRYTASSIINELEKRGLGTKSTRADIVDNLYKRGYVDEKSITATELGMRIVDSLEKYAPDILNEELTRGFEDEMQGIRDGTQTPDKVLAHAHKELDKTLHVFKSHEQAIGAELIQAHRDSEDVKNTLGSCPNCEPGMLKIMYSKKNKKKFVACDQYPDCRTTSPLPAGCIVKSTEKLCEHDGWPLIQVLRRGSKPQELCLSTDCVTKKNLHAQKMIGKPCPKCGKPLDVKRSVYGEFVGCSDYPKCKYTENSKA